MRSPAPVREWPLTVRLFVAVVLVWDAAYLAYDTTYVGNHASRSFLWQIFGLAALAAMAGWRQRWAWWTFLMGPIMFWASPAWGARFRPFWDAVELLIFGLLVSPSLRRHVFVASSRTAWLRRPGRAWIVCLALSGAISLPTALTARHHASHSIVTQVTAEVLLWLVVAGAMRLVAFIFQGATRLAGPRGDAPPATGTDT